MRKRSDEYMTTIIAHVGDLHVNSTVALMPLEVMKDDGQIVKQSRTQEWIWDKWLSFWKETQALKKKHKAQVIGVINGDWGDVNTHSGFQLIEGFNPDIILTMMVDAVQPAMPVVDYWVVVRGTEAHTGGSGWLENRAAKEIGAVKNFNEKSKKQAYTHSWYLWEAEVEGVKITSAHHPGTNSGRPWTIGNEANRRAAMDVYNYVGRDWCPDITLWGHFHHMADSGDTHPVRAIYNRSWQAKTAFVHRIGKSNEVSEIGGLWIICKKGEPEVIKKEYKLPRPKIWKS